MFRLVFFASFVPRRFEKGLVLLLASGFCFCFFLVIMMVAARIELQSASLDSFDVGVGH